VNEFVSIYGQTLITFLTAGGLVLASMGMAYRKFVRPFMRRMDALSALVEYQMRPNGGKSLLDKVNMIDQNHQEVLRLIAENNVEIARKLAESNATVAETLLASNATVATRLEEIVAKDTP